MAMVDRLNIFAARKKKSLIIIAYNDEVYDLIKSNKKTNKHVHAC